VVSFDSIWSKGRSLASSTALTRPSAPDRDAKGLLGSARHQPAPTQSFGKRGRRQAPRIEAKCHQRHPLRSALGQKRPKLPRLPGAKRCYGAGGEGVAPSLLSDNRWSAP
jgi:hypothetical protein